MSHATEQTLPLHKKVFVLPTFVTGQWVLKNLYLSLCIKSEPTIFAQFHVKEVKENGDVELEAVLHRQDDEAQHVSPAIQH